MLRDEEHALPASSIYQRRAQALTTFVGYAVKPTTTTSSTDTVLESRAVGDLVLLLIQNATVPEDGVIGTALEEISNAARSSLSRVLSIMFATDFIAAVLSMLESGDSRVRLFLC
jgi:U3 small nucleolar RNA-associated protein 10